MLWAITGKTAAEIIESRSNPDKPNMGLTSWRGSIVRKYDAGIARNYLKADEIKDLNEIVTMYLDYAERQARQRKTITMEQWSDKLDAFLEFNEKEMNWTTINKTSSSTTPLTVKPRSPCMPKTAWSG